LRLPACCMCGACGRQRNLKRLREEIEVSLVTPSTNASACMHGTSTPDVRFVSCMTCGRVKAGQGLTATPGSKTMQHALDLMAWEQAVEDGAGRDQDRGMLRLTRLVLARFKFQRLQCSPHAASGAAMYLRAIGGSGSGPSDAASLPVIHVPAAVDVWAPILAEAGTEAEVARVGDGPTVRDLEASRSLSVPVSLRP
jgi:hypothetical protein